MGNVFGCSASITVLNSDGNPMYRGVVFRSFSDKEVEAAYHLKSRHWVVQHGQHVIVVLAGINFLIFLLTLAAESELAWAYRANAIVDVIVLLVAGALFDQPFWDASKWYEMIIATVVLHMSFSTSFFNDRLASALEVLPMDYRPGFFLEANALLVVSGASSAIPVLARLSLKTCALVMTAAIGMHLVGHLALGSLEYARAADDFPQLPAHGAAAAIQAIELSVFALSIFWSRRREERLRQAAFSSRSATEQDPSSSAEEPESVVKLPEPKLPGYPIKERQSSAEDRESLPRKVDVPPPSKELDAPQHHAFVVHDGYCPPNLKLVEAMTGRVADANRILRMAESIRLPDYTLKEFFDDCIASFPELRLFFLGDSSICSTSGESNEGEYQRTIGALFSCYWLLRLQLDGKSGWCHGYDGNWNLLRPETDNDVVLPGMAFGQMSESQKRASFRATMSWQMFENLVTQAGCSSDELGSTQRIMALLCLTACHDIMKVEDLLPAVQPEHAPYQGYNAGDTIRDHDMALRYILEHFPHLVPSYSVLDPVEQRVILFTQGKMNFNHGWFVQAEGPPGAMLASFKRILKEGAEPADVSFYFLHWFTDLAGAEATPLGGAEKFVLKFPHAVLTSFLWSIPYLRHLTKKTETEVVETYLQARWHVIAPDLNVPDDSEAIACMRIAVMAQSDARVVEVFRQLPRRDKRCLAVELARTGCTGQRFSSSPSVRGGPAFLVYYGPALLQKNVDGDMFTALRVLSEVLRAGRALWPVSDSEDGVTITIQIAQLKTEKIELIMEGSLDVQQQWVLARHNDLEGSVERKHTSEVVAMTDKGTPYKLLNMDPIGEASKASGDSGSETDLPMSVSISSAAPWTSKASSLDVDDHEFSSHENAAKLLPDLTHNRRGTLCVETELASLRQESWLLTTRNESISKEVEYLRARLMELDPEWLESLPEKNKRQMSGARLDPIMPPGLGRGANGLPAFVEDEGSDNT